jgi:hypothetical protein
MKWWQIMMMIMKWHSKTRRLVHKAFLIYILLYFEKKKNKNKQTNKQTKQSKKSKAIPVNRLWKPIGLRDVEDRTLSRQSAHRWRWGCQPYAPAALYSPETFSGTHFC